MSLVKSLVSGTQNLGEMNIWISIIILSLFIILLVVILFVVSFNSKWPPKCTKDNKENCSNFEKWQVILGLIFIILLLGVIVYYTYSNRNNKTFQTIEGVGAEAGMISSLFN